MFWAIAIVLWQTKSNIFYLFNFCYIGTAVGVGIGLYVLLPRKNKPSGRRLTQLIVGIYTLGFLGLIKEENMQLEGFFFCLLTGLFAGSVIHYMVAKIIGPILFGRVSVVGPVGQLWFSIFYLLSETKMEEFQQNGR